jgi:hypothetical protein
MRRRAAAFSANDRQQRLPEPAADDELGRLAHTLNATRQDCTGVTNSGNENDLRHVQRPSVLVVARRSGRNASSRSTGKWTMNVSSVSHTPPVTSPARLSPSNVSAAALKAAAGDGDGRTGAAALNDGDAAAQNARRGAIDIKA